MAKGIVSVKYVPPTTDGPELDMANVRIEIDEDEPKVLYTGLHHAREPESMEQLIYFIY